MDKNQGKITVEAPSNIAFVKYWGKQARQHPINPSVSMTLKQCVTKCTVQYAHSDEFKLESYNFENKEHSEFKKRIEKYLNCIVDICPWLKTSSLSIETTNSFPHSAGIASSASAFAALGYALAHIEGSKNIERRASELARLGSGSAARSIEGPYTLWGESEFNQSSNDYAVQLSEIHQDFENVKNTILIIDAGKKAVSSSEGHALMDSHPFKAARIDQAHDNTRRVIASLRDGDWEIFGETIENEALTLHAMMMSSKPSFMLLAPQTLSAISQVQSFRRETKEPLYFTIDAGPNMHLIYPQKHSAKIEKFICSELVPLCQDEQIIKDENGQGARIINEQ